MALALCCYTTHDRSFPVTCSNRVKTFWSPLNYRSCDPAFASSVGCIAVPSSKQMKQQDFNGGAGSGCAGWVPPVSNVGSAIPFTTYDDVPC
jgi:hypothetical protein